MPHPVGLSIGLLTRGQLAFPRVQSKRFKGVKESKGARARASDSKREGGRGRGERDRERETQREETV